MDLKKWGMILLVLAVGYAIGIKFPTLYKGQL